MFGRDEKVSEERLTAAQYIILGIFLVLAYGLWRLQVMQADYYSLAAEKNRIRNVPVLAPRGRILDRYGRTVVDNYPSFSALLLRDSSRDLNADADLIAQGLHLEPNEVRARIRRFATMPQYQPIFLKEDITPDELQFIEAHRNELPELDTIMAHRRLYPRNGFMAHLVGYVGEVTDDMLNQPQFELYNPGDVVGISGVERQYNDLLMGKNGSRQALVDSHGREVGRLGETDAIPGKPLKLTVDIDLQIAAEQALAGKNGAIVAMDPRTGEILAMASGPTFDPNDFAVRVSRDEWNKLVTDPDKPLLNKAIQAQLAPGSTFKIIMSVAGWQEGIAQNLRVHCGGSADFYGRNYKCWVYFLHQSHGEVDLEKAIYQSCDVFFYTLADRLGIGRIAKYASVLGLGQKTGIDLPNEVSGVMPSEEWKIRNFKQKWFAGETISVGIGQGAVAVTPVQLLRAISAISMGGRMVVPHVINPTDMPPGLVEAARYTEVKTIPISDDGWNYITDAMSRVLLPEGTAPSAHIAGIDIAGKTGSAQVVSLNLRAKMKNSSEFAQNGWFVGFTPRRSPEIVVCVLFQGGEHGKLAARLATQVIKAYVEKRDRNPQKMTDKGNGTVDVGGLWSEPDTGAEKDVLQAGRFVVDLAKKPPVLATAAPGMN
ncbi:MAG TPA: penicillin-binding protein 2 [Candidatus Sulfotelmatobacter sp.]|nr:penicillin-binding protein 2 [Candidatus Sulfotelmatobacter sp.]